MIKTRGDWYSNDFVLYNIISQLRHRYLSTIRDNKEKGKGKIPSRYYMGYSIPLLKNSLERNNVLIDTSAKIYFDLATWKDENGITPIFSFNMKERKEQKKKFTGNLVEKNGEYRKLMKSYDFAIDLDSKNPKTSYKEAVKIKEIFDKYKLPYSVRFSGTKGFHFVIDAKWIPTRKSPLDRPELFGKIVSNLAKDGLLKTVDHSIYDDRRILKLAYSLCNNNGVEYVALPLDENQFKNWKYEDMRMTEVAKPYNVELFRRGLLERNMDLTERKLKANVSKFMKDYK